MSIDEITVFLIDCGISRAEVRDLLDQNSKTEMIKNLKLFEENILPKKSYTPDEKLKYLKNLNNYNKK